MTARERAGNRGLAAARAAVAREYYLLAELVASEDHRSATRLLASVQPHGQDLAKHLAKVVAIKDQVHYSGDPLPDSRMRSVLRSTARLVDEAERAMVQA
jgi:hypothetical protein